MYNKRLKNRAFKTSGPLQKMIDAAVDERMTALKSEHDAEWSDWMETKREQLDDGRTKITEGRQGTIPGSKDDYSGEGGYAPDDVWNEWLQTPEGIEYTERHSPQEVAEERVKFLDAVPEQMEKREVSEVPRVEREQEQKPSYLQTPVGGKNIMELFNVNPELGGNLTENAKSFYDMTFSVDNPVLEVLNDDKWMRKARKEYEKSVKKRVGSSSKDQYKYKSKMPFERWAMTRYVPKGQEKDLAHAARIWEGDNSSDTDNSQFLLPDGTEAMDREIKGAGYVAASRNKKSNPFDRYKEQQKAEVDGGQQPVTQMSRPMAKMLKGRTMSFKKINMNQAPGFKMKRK